MKKKQHKVKRELGELQKREVKPIFEIEVKNGYEIIKDEVTKTTTSRETGWAFTK